ncbi:ArpU family phage packaging/lysis transcriptional regulator [Paenibacillus nicotianae]|uniref:ArpU family phage packaging/lysis transcriptional regulator n=1 Tax=Paenibacillus nicotianae TaxID=1526551 RepID=A0ABW4UT44_9BACL
MENNEVFQLCFPGTSIDESATFDRVEKELKKAAFYEQYGFVRDEAKTTPSYIYKENSGMGEISKQTENIAIRNIDKEDSLHRSYMNVTRALNRLSMEHRNLITSRYMCEPEPIDLNVYTSLGMSERTYYRVKKEALSKLAYSLNLEVRTEPIEG